MSKKERKIKLKNIMIVITIMVMMIIGKASWSMASSFSFNAHADKKEVIPGEEVIVEMSVSDIDMGKHGVNVVEGILEYDKSFFSSMELLNENDWKITYNSEQGERQGKFLTLKMAEGVKGEETIGKIKLKVREDITEGEGQIKIKNILSNDGESLIDDGERIITIVIKKTDTSNKPNTPNVPEGTPGDGKDKNILQESTTQYEKVENADTGDNIKVVIGIIAGVVLVNIGIVFVNKKRDKKEN